MAFGIGIRDSGHTLLIPVRIILAADPIHFPIRYGPRVRGWYFFDWCAIAIYIKRQIFDQIWGGKFDITSDGWQKPINAIIREKEKRKWPLKIAVKWWNLEFKFFCLCLKFFCLKFFCRLAPRTIRQAILIKVLWFSSKNDFVGKTISEKILE